MVYIVPILIISSPIGAEFDDRDDTIEQIPTVLFNPWEPYYSYKKAVIFTYGFIDSCVSKTSTAHHPRSSWECSIFMSNHRLSSVLLGYQSRSSCFICCCLRRPNKYWVSQGHGYPSHRVEIYNLFHFIVGVGDAIRHAGHQKECCQCAALWKILMKSRFWGVWMPRPA